MPVYTRGDKCYAQVSFKGKPHYGPRRSLTPTGRRQAQRDEIELYDQLHADPTGPMIPTIAEFRDDWQRLHPNGQANKPREASTWIIYMERTKKFAAEHGERLIDSVTRTQARAWALDHPGTVGPLRTMFGDAGRDDLLSGKANPFADLRLGRAPGRRDITPIGLDELTELTQAATAIAGASFAAMIALAAATAMREAECFAVSRDDANLAEQEIRVAWQYRTKVGAPNAGQPDERWAPPKNGKARTVVLAPLALAAMAPVVPAADGPLRPPDGAPIWLLTPTGEHFTTRTHHYYWRQVRAAVGRPDLHFHDLKHFAGWYMLNVLELEPHYIAHQLAHSDTELLFRLYGHPEEKVANKAIKQAFARDAQPNVRRLRAV